MLQYLYTFRGHQTHQDPFYNRRAKGGETDSVGRLTATSSEKEIFAQVRKRIKQQDNAAVSEPPVILGYWFVENPTGVINIDDMIREILITRHGGKVTRDDKNKTEWVTIPREFEAERIALYEQCIRECEAINLVERQMIYDPLWDVQEEITNSVTAAVAKALHIAGCGVGKTYVELFELETNPPGVNQVNVLFTSGIELANQLCEKFTYHTTTNQPFGSRLIIPVHSGKCTVDGIEATCEELEIARRIQNATQPVWLVVVLDSARTAARGIALAGRTVNFKAIDEIHRTAGVGSTKYRDALLMKCIIQRGYSASYRVVRS